MILDDLPTPFSIHNNNDHNTARTQPHLQEGSLTNTALSPAKATSSSKNNLSEDVAAPFNTSSTSTALPNSHQQQPQLQQQQESTLGSGVANKSAPLVLPIERTSILTLESILTTPSTQSNSPSGSIVMTMAGEATTFFDDMMEDICSSSTSVLTTSTSASGTISASTTIHTSTSATTTTAAIPISSSSGIKALLQQHQQQQQQQTSATTNTTTTIVGGFLTPSPTQSLPELYHDFFDPIRAGTGGAEQRYDDSDQSMSDAEMEMEMDLDMMEDAPTVRARLAEMRRALETVVCRAPLIADIPYNLEKTIDTINLMNHQPNGSAIVNGTGQQSLHTLQHHQQQQQQQQQQSQHHLHQGHDNKHHTHPNGHAPDNSNSNNNNNNLNNTNGNGNNNNSNNNNNTNNNNRSDDQGAGSPPDQQSAPQRRKKASRACFHCQKAHLTCDDSRPCQRCVKRDLASTCADGVRKKAKYLQDAYDSQQVAAEQAAQGGNINAVGMDQKSLLSDQDQQRQGPGGMEESPLTDANALFNFPMNSDYGFGSEAVNLEYSIISTMLSSPTAELNSMSDLSMVENWQRQGSLEAMANLANSNQLQKALAAQGAAAAAAAASVGPGPGSGASGSNGGLTNAGATNHANGASANNNSHNNSNNNVNNAANNNNNNNSNNSSAANNATMGLLGPGAPTANNATAPTGFHPPGVARVSKRKFPSNTPENVYANTKQPFNYTDGFHYLLRYVRERMDKEEMMRICRAMAMFRPSFIALIMNLTPEDLIFMEKCFQRTILEFEKLISFSGTPTVVWRRTGEIALVGKEFSLLTQWGRDQLVGKKTYIYELMDNQSAVEYWEKFSTHAFENTEQTVMTTCILLSPTNRVVPCTFCFTIKRDIFDIPLAIVGNFLPILS